MSKKWKTGYCIVDIESFNFDYFKCLKDAAIQCEKFIVGIPDIDVIKFLFGDKKQYDLQSIKEFYSEIRWIDDVVVLGLDYLDYKKAFEAFSFDVCFCGSQYGLAFERDKIFMESQGSFLIPLMPEKLERTSGLSAIEKFLSHNGLRKKIILFGTGAYFDSFLSVYGNQYKPSYAIDNNPDKWGTWKKNIMIKNPVSLKEEDSKEVVIIICSKKYQDMLHQLKEMGEYDYRLLLCYNGTALLEETNLIVKSNREDKVVLDKVHKINYEMLKEFNWICREHHIQYFLNYGSCLGAIRHKGFIPWDNDVDVCMTRENYEKLVPWKDEFSDEYRFVPPDDLGKNKYFDCVPRLNYKKAYICMDQDACRYYENHNNRIDLDMFLIDKTYDTFKGKIQRLELAFLYGLMNAYRHESSFSDYSKSMRLVNGILRRIGCCLSLDWLRKRVDKVAKRFNNDGEAPYYFISNCALCKLKLLFPADVFSKAIDVPFEDLQVPVPLGYDKFLQLIFGDYMSLPHEKDRVPHWGRVLITADTFVFDEPGRSD